MTKEQAQKIVSQISRLVEDKIETNNADPEDSMAGCGCWRIEEELAELLVTATS